MYYTIYCDFSFKNLLGYSIKINNKDSLDFIINGMDNNFICGEMNFSTRLDNIHEKDETELQRYIDIEWIMHSENAWNMFNNII